MARSFKEAKSEINDLLWEIGWNEKKTLAAATGIGVVVGHYLNDVSGALLWGFIGLFAGAVVWVAGTRYINQNYESILDGFYHEAADTAQELLRLEEEDNVETYSLHAGTGSRPLRTPNLKYSTSTMLVTDYSLIVHEGNELDMVDLSAEISQSTEEIYFDQVASVNYEPDNNEFWVNRADGHGMSWKSDREPDDALDDIQRRVRDYKRQSA